MLALGRRENESIVILLPDGRTVTVTTKRRTVLMFDAPQDVRIERSELDEKRKREMA